MVRSRRRPSPPFPPLPEGEGGTSGGAPAPGLRPVRLPFTPFRVAQGRPGLSYCAPSGLPEGMLQIEGTCSRAGAQDHIQLYRPLGHGPTPGVACGAGYELGRDRDQWVRRLRIGTIGDAASQASPLGLLRQAAQDRPRLSTDRRLRRLGSDDSGGRDGEATGGALAVGRSPTGARDTATVVRSWRAGSSLGTAPPSE